MSTKRINIARRLDGVLTDYSTLPVLRDPTLAYGVKRVSNGAVIVAAGTAFTRDSEGVYHYDLTGLADGDDYLAYIETVNASGAVKREPRTWTQGAPADNTGKGDFPVDHSGGDGVTVDGAAAVADVMQFTVPGGAGADDVRVVAYLKADYDAGKRSVEYRRGSTRTGSDGRWLAPLMLDAGAYTIIGNKDGYQAEIFTVVVP